MNDTILIIFAILQALAFLIILYGALALLPDKNTRKRGIEAIKYGALAVVGSFLLEVILIFAF